MKERNWKYYFRHLPEAINYSIKRYLFLKKNRKIQFTSIYRTGGFGNSPSLSGAGSDMQQTAIIRAELPKIIRKYSIKSILDVPCGDMYWMQHVDLHEVSYTGADIVDELIRENNVKFGSTQKKFIVLDIVKDLIPPVDMIFCRDCLIHMKLNDVKKALLNFKSSGSKYLLTTTYPSITINDELGLNFFRPLNLQAPPFYLTSPIELINEKCSLENNKYRDKSLGLWKLSEIL